jgi:hypothetical protein
MRRNFRSWRLAAESKYEKENPHLRPFEQVLILLAPGQLGNHLEFCPLKSVKVIGARDQTARRARDEPPDDGSGTAARHIRH